MTTSRLHLLWIIPLTLLLTSAGFLLSTFGWCGDDALGCRFGPWSALQSAIPPVVAAIFVAMVVGAIYAGVTWSARARLRRRIGLVVGFGYLALVVAFLVITLSINGWSQS